MVPHDIQERRSYARYALEHIRTLAYRRNVSYPYLNVQAQVANLGLGLDGVCSLLEQLTDHEFKESILYSDSANWHDVYLVPATPITGAPGQLYVKFHLSPSRMWIILCSCHPEGQP